MNGSSKHRSPSELNVRDREHYEVSRYLSVWFDKARFVEANKFAATQVKVVTERSVVYLMGIVSRAEGDAAAQIAATTSGVLRVIKVLD